MIEKKTNIVYDHVDDLKEWKFDPDLHYRKVVLSSKPLNKMRLPQELMMNVNLKVYTEEIKVNALVKV